MSHKAWIPHKEKHSPKTVASLANVFMNFLILASSMSIFSPSVLITTAAICTRSYQILHKTNKTMKQREKKITFGPNLYPYSCAYFKSNCPFIARSNYLLYFQIKIRGKKEMQVCLETFEEVLGNTESL